MLPYNSSPHRRERLGALSHLPSGRMPLILGPWNLEVDYPTPPDLLFESEQMSKVRAPHVLGRNLLGLSAPYLPSRDPSRSSDPLRVAVAEDPGGERTTVGSSQGRRFGPMMPWCHLAGETPPNASTPTIFTRSVSSVERVSTRLERPYRARYAQGGFRGA